jgi:flavin reductase
MMELTDFKAAMRRLVAGVTIIATQTEDGKRHGLAATAVTSVTTDPPTLLCCVNQSASAALHISVSRRFSVNVLPIGATEISQRFSGVGPADERFAIGAWKTLSTGAPILHDAITAFDCRVTEQMTMGSHFIFFGAVEAVHLAAEATPPLLYGMAGYGTFAPAAPS